MCDIYSLRNTRARTTTTTTTATGLREVRRRDRDKARTSTAIVSSLLNLADRWRWPRTKRSSGCAAASRRRTGRCRRRCAEPRRPPTGADRDRTRAVVVVTLSRRVNTRARTDTRHDTAAAPRGQKTIPSRSPPVALPAARSPPTHTHTDTRTLFRDFPIVSSVLYYYYFHYCYYYCFDVSSF